MAKITLAPLGVNAAMVSDHKRTPPPRTGITGWSVDAARRNRQFLTTIDPKRLDGLGVGFTLTVRDCPATSKEWARMVDTLRKRLARMGSLRDHWVVEWQKRGVPHLHGFVYFDRDQFGRLGGIAQRLALPYGPHQPEFMASFDAFAGELFVDAIKRAWLDIAKACGPRDLAQHGMVLTGVAGWVQYLSKHAARGADHYQRERNKLPAGWQSTGRLWGKGGYWPTSSDAFEVDKGTFHRFRRLVRRWSISKAKTQIQRGRRYRNPVQIRSGMAALRYHRTAEKGSDHTPAQKRRWSEVRGLGSSFPAPWSLYALEWALEAPDSRLRVWAPDDGLRRL